MAVGLCRVSPRMAAVLAVALLLLCSGVRSQDMEATITQVKVPDTPSPTNNTVPLITNTTEGSGDTHSAVLANAALGEQESALVLVDLARDDKQQMTNMTTAAPPAAPPAVPEGFDMNEFDNADPVFAASTAAPPAESTVPEGFDMNEFDESPSLAATQGEGHVVTGFPEIGSSEDNSQGQGYGVQAFGAPSASGSGGDSFATYQPEDPSFAVTTQSDEGHLVPGFPGIGSSQDSSQGQGYGVQTYNAPAPASGGDVLAVYGQDDQDSSENVTLTSTRTYQPIPPKPAPAQAWRQGRCTFYGGMDAAGTMCKCRVLKYNEFMFS